MRSAGRAAGRLRPLRRLNFRWRVYAPNCQQPSVVAPCPVLRLSSSFAPAFFSCVPLLIHAAFVCEAVEPSMALCAHRQLNCLDAGSSVYLCVSRFPSAPSPASRPPSAVLWITSSIRPFCETFVFEVCKQHLSHIFSARFEKSAVQTVAPLTLGSSAPGHTYGSV